MDIDEPVKTINGETAREAAYPITLHIGASLANSNTDYNLGEIEVDMPINLEPTASADGMMPAENRICPASVKASGVSLPEWVVSRRGSPPSLATM